MKRKQQAVLRRGTTTLLVLSISICGCSRYPQAPKWPAIDATEAAQNAVEMYDQDSDGLLSTEELTKSPSLSNSRKRLDQDQDGFVSADEISARINQWLTSGTTLVEVIAMVSANGKPLVNASVTVEPEPFLGEDYVPVTATTDDTGMATFSGHDSRLPGLHLGFYRVRISRLDDAGRETVSATFNSRSTLGIEVAGDKSNLAQFSVVTK